MPHACLLWVCGVDTFPQHRVNEWVHLFHMTSSEGLSLALSLSQKGKGSYNRASLKKVSCCLVVHGLRTISVPFPSSNESGDVSCWAVGREEGFILYSYSAGREKCSCGIWRRGTRKKTPKNNKLWRSALHEMRSIKSSVSSPCSSSLCLVFSIDGG